MSKLEIANKVAAKFAASVKCPTAVVTIKVGEDHVLCVRGEFAGADQADAIARQLSKTVAPALRCDRFVYLAVPNFQE